MVRFLQKDDRGQDLAEYCLIMALVMLVALGIFIKVSGGIQRLWDTGNGAIATANTAANGTTASATGGGTASGSGSTGSGSPGSASPGSGSSGSGTPNEGADHSKADSH